MSSSIKDDKSSQVYNCMLFPAPLQAAALCSTRSASSQQRWNITLFMKWWFECRWCQGQYYDAVQTVLTLPDGCGGKYERLLFKCFRPRALTFQFFAKFACNWKSDNVVLECFTWTVFILLFVYFFLIVSTTQSDLQQKPRSPIFT